LVVVVMMIYSNSVTTIQVFGFFPRSFFELVIIIIIIIIIIYSNWVSTRWQWSVILYKNRKETPVCKKRNNTQNSTKTEITQNRKQKYETKANIKDY